MGIFGTDGIRDLAGQGHLAPDVVRRIGHGLARFAGGEGATVVLGRDPRPSGRELGRILAGAFSAAGLQVEDLGVVPTPVVAWTVAHRGLDLGLALSASHNPPDYNGIKPFARGGRKLEPEEEHRIEAWADLAPAAASVEAEWRPVDGAGAYVDATTPWLAIGGRLDGLRLVVDLAAGAATATAVPVLEGLGATVLALHPANARAINDGCGTEHPEAWLAALRAMPGALGLAFDGDADRVLLADENADIVDGDDILQILAQDALEERGEVPSGKVVGTVMANLGLEERLRELHVDLERTAVGDRQVAGRMRELGAVFGAEPSGHVVLERERALIGDGLVAGVRVLQALRRLGCSLSELRSQTPRYPQLLVGVRVGERRPLDEVPAIQDALASAEARLGKHGRLVVRYSGTEPLLRIMAEGHDAAEVSAVVEDLARIAKQSLER
jgi:phosphoglucosamine mutase